MSATAVIQIRNPTPFYFGKISSRGDFVKSTSGTKVIALIDNWIAQGMDMLIAAPGWKEYYDNAGVVDFLLIGTRKRHAICGSLVPSGDASTRRFPFIAATLFEVDNSLYFLPLSPYVLERHVNHQRALAHHAAKTHDAVEALSALHEIPLEPEFPKSLLAKNFEQFLSSTSIAGLASMLSLGHGGVTVRQIILAIGYLLEPVLTTYAAPPHKGLALPLPRDSARLVHVKALWLQLISVFLSRAEFDLSAFSCVHYGRPKLIVTFNGTTPSTFHALFEEQAAVDCFIDVTEAAWVDEYSQQNPATSKLSTYLEHGDLSLHQMLETFRQGFAA
ncbi:MAG TPA: type VI secretion system-associated protein TagF [Noviherbaspirillum sp.]|nr:type VI secretion system-associated protein TagF [Noviherbaspirillum sp.]